MNAIKRAVLYLSRKRGKTFSLFAFLLAAATMMLTCISIYSATDTAIFNIKKSLMGYFTVNAKRLDGGLNKGIIDQILTTEGLSRIYNLRSYTVTNFYNENGELLEVETEGASIANGYENAGTVTGTDNSAGNTYFADEIFELVEGTEITEKRENTVLVHQNFAKRNNLSVGDTIQLEDVETRNRITLTIIGIFDNARRQESSMNYSYGLYENMVFTNMDICSVLLFGEKGHCKYGDFYVNDPEELDRIIEDIKSIPNVFWEDCTFAKHDTDYQNAKESLVSIQNIVFVAVVIITAITFVILSLLLVFRTRNRVHEMGVLLSMGIPKKSILLQQLTEVLIVTVFAILFSFASASLIAGQVGNTLLSRAAAEEYEVVDVTGNGEEAESRDVSQTEMGLAQIDVSVSLTDYVMVWGVGLLLCTISTIIAVIPVLRVKPKNILSQMN